MPAPLGKEALYYEEEMTNCFRPPNFTIVNFLDEKGNTTKEQEIVLISWIVPGNKGTRCWWLKDDTISRRQLENLVKAETTPKKDDFGLYAARVLKDKG